MCLRPTLQTKSKYSKCANSDQRAVCSLANLVLAVSLLRWAYLYPSARCEALSCFGNPKKKIHYTTHWTQTKNLPPSVNAFGEDFSFCVIQPWVQKQVWEWEPNPPSLCAAGLSQHMPTRATRINRPSGCFSVWIKSPFSHRSSNLVMSTHRNCCTWSGFCSFGPGIMAASIKLVVR
jgi:hypothetical protein